MNHKLEISGSQLESCVFSFAEGSQFLPKPLLSKNEQVKKASFKFIKK